MATGGLASAVKVELVLVKSLQMAGFDPVVLGPPDPLVRRYYELAGMRRYVSWQELFPEDQGHFPLAFRTFEEVLAFESSGARVGKYAASWVMRKLRVGSVDPTATQVWEVLVDHLRKGINYAHAAQEVLRRFSPHTALFLEHGYSPWGELFDLCVESGVDTLQWNGCHKDNALMLKRYKKSNAHMHPASLSEDSWKEVVGMPWGEREAEALRRELYDNYHTGQWFGEVGTQFHKRMYDRPELQARLGLDSGRKTAIIFPHMFWDATFFYGRDLFNGYQEWFVRTVEAAAANTDLNWVIKIHPANVVKNQRDGVRGELSEKAVLRHRFGSLPSHIKLVDADCDISTFSLFSVMDYCLTVRGTIGIEAASFGIPVLTAGTGRYDRLGFTEDPDTAEEYLNRVRRLQEVPLLTAAQRELAQRYAFAVFVMRPFELESLRLEYSKDETASANVEMRVRTLREMVEAEDLQAFTRWALDGSREDFLRRSMRRGAAG